MTVPEVISDGGFNGPRAPVTVPNTKLCRLKKKEEKKLLKDNTETWEHLMERWTASEQVEPFHRNGNSPEFV